MYLNICNDKDKTNSELPLLRLDYNERYEKNDLEKNIKF